MYSDSGDDSCDEKMMLTIHTDVDPEEKLVMIRSTTNKPQDAESSSLDT